MPMRTYQQNDLDILIVVVDAGEARIDNYIPSWNFRKKVRGGLK